MRCGGGAAEAEENTKGRGRYDGGRSDRGQCYHSRWDFSLSPLEGRTEGELHHHIGIGFFSAAVSDCRPDSSPEIEIATFPPSLSLLFSSTSGPKNYRTSFSLRRAIRAEVSCLTFVLLPSPEKVESVVTTRDRGRKQEGELQPLLAFTLQDPKATCGRNVVRDQSCLTTQV